VALDGKGAEAVGEEEEDAGRLCRFDPRLRVETWGTRL